MSDYDIYFPVMVEVRDGVPVSAAIEWDGAPMEGDNAWDTSAEKWTKVWPEPEEEAFRYLQELLKKGAT